MGKKTTQKQSKMILSAGWKTFKHGKLGNYKSHINETSLIYVRPICYEVNTILSLTSLTNSL